jgi:hypothetical protein
VIEMLRIWLMAMLAAAVLVTVRNHDLLHRTHLLSSCTATQAPPNAHGAWRACRKGLLNGRPDLAGERCLREGRSGSLEYWLCRPPVTAQALR